MEKLIRSWEMKFGLMFCIMIDARVLKCERIKPKGQRFLEKIKFLINTFHVDNVVYA